MTSALPLRALLGVALALPAVFTACAGPGPSPAPMLSGRPAGQLREGSYGPEAAISLSALEAQAIDVARARLTPRDRARPRISGSLTAAARILARDAADGVSDPLSRTAIRDALARACAYDPAPVAFLVRASPARLGESLARAIAGATASHVGAGAVEISGETVVVVLGSRRRARLDPFPREVTTGATATLSGELRSGLRAPHVFVTLPSGRVREQEVAGAGAFRSPIPFTERGRYVVELVADGPGGPTVAALMAVSAGGASVETPRAPETPDPSDPAEAEAQVVAALSALRARHGLPPVTSSPELAEVARRHSAAMRAAGEVAHLVPGSPGPGDRLARARIAYQRVFENVAAARSALAAHEAAAESPAHLRNMLEPSVSRVGVGIARAELATGDPRVFLTEMLIQPAEDGEGSRLTLDARVREELWRERARLGLPPLTADVALDELAREGAGELRRRDVSELPDLARRALALHRGLAAADAFVAGATRDAIRSQNLRNARFRRVGVGVVEGTSRRFGAGRLFITVIYSD